MSNASLSLNGVETIEHVIIGGGLCGCYIALQLLSRGITSFVILEEKGRYRGKQKSIHKYAEHFASEAVTLELGSSVFHSSQSKLLSLLRFLGLDDLIRYVAQGEAFYTYPGLSPREAKQKFKSLRSQLQQAAISLRGEKQSHPVLTVEQLAKQLFTTHEVEILKGCYPEWFEIAEMNAYSYGIQEKYMGKWMKLEGGLEQILDEATHLLEPYFRWNHPVFDVTRKGVDAREKGKSKFIIDVVGEFMPKIECLKLYICCNLKSAQKNIQLRDCPNVSRYISLGQYKPSLRYYVILKRDIPVEYQIISGPSFGHSAVTPQTKDSWLCKFSIQITPRVWLISYPDGELVDRLIEKDLSKNLLKLWIEQMNHFFQLDLTIKDILHTEVAVWNDAFTVLTPGWYQSFNQDPQTVRYIQDDVLITCLPNEFHQAWMEGHLFRVPDDFTRSEDRFVERMVSYLSTHGIKVPSGPILSSALLPVALDASQRFFVCKERRGSEIHKYNLFGGKVSDKYWINIEGALRALYNEMAEELCFVIDVEFVAKAIRSVLFKPNTKSSEKKEKDESGEQVASSYALIIVVDVHPDDVGTIKERWNAENQRRLHIEEDIPDAFTELEGAEWLERDDVLKRDDVTYYLKEVTRLAGETSVATTEPLRSHHFLPVRIDALGYSTF